MSNEQSTAATPIGLDEETDEAASSPAHQRDLSGQLLSDRYLVEGCLGVGGMGTVYRAEHTLMKKTVAIKVLHSDIVGQGEAVERFRREAQAAAHIDHPNVCVATDFGEMAGGGFFLVMEYLEGNTLDETLVCVEHLEPRRAIHIADQILSALQQAHKLGVVHRDLKPENVMLVERGGDVDFVKIMDFGVARVRMDQDGNDAGLTQAGRVYGTPMYMSPEQVAGAKDIDHRADLYTVGVMLFEMLSGTLPFVDENPARIMAMHVTEDRPSLRQRIPEARIPKRLDDLVQRLMARDRDERPESARHVRQELARIKERGSTQSWMAFTRDAADTSGVAIRQVAREVRPRIEQARTWVNQNSIVRGASKGALAALLVVLFIGSVAYFAWPDGGASTLQERQEQAKDLAEQRDLYLEDLGAGEVAKSLATGSVEEALTRLAGLDERHGPNEHIAFLHGRAHATAGDWRDALEHYRRALDLEPRYASEDRLLDDVVDRLESRDDEQAELAAEILLEQVPREVGNRRLGAIAMLGDNGAARRRARTALEDSGRFAQLDAWLRASIGLRFAHGCSEHREHIDAIVEAGEPQGLQILRFYDRQPRRGCGTFKQNDCYGCIRKDLAAAIAALEEVSSEESGEPEAEVSAEQ